MLARQIREVVIPEVDTYTYGCDVCRGGHKPAAVKLTEENIYTEMLRVARLWIIPRCRRPVAF